MKIIRGASIKRVIRSTPAFTEGRRGHDGPGSHRGACMLKTAVGAASFGFFPLRKASPLWNRACGAFFSVSFVQGVPGYTWTGPWFTPNPWDRGLFAIEPHPVQERDVPLCHYPRARAAGWGLLRE